jgi:eukaryotic-like serine/threonine-protein kinase
VADPALAALVDELLARDPRHRPSSETIASQLASRRPDEPASPSGQSAPARGVPSREPVNSVPVPPRPPVRRRSGRRPAVDEAATVVAGRYCLRAQLGLGRLGPLFEAQDQHRLEAVALRVLATRQALDAEVRERFAASAAGLKKLRHAALVRALDGGVEDGAAYVVHELVHGPSLTQLAAGEPVGPARIRELLAPIAHALAYAHRHGVLHQALGPGSILLDERRGARLADTGLAWGVEALRDGLPGFAAPEQGAGRRPTAAADAYALGSIAFWLATGEPPFVLSDPDSDRRRRTDRARPLSLAAPAVAVADPALAALVDELLARDPRHRPSSETIASQLASRRRTDRSRRRWARRLWS